MSNISQQQVKHWHEEKEILAVRMEISSDHTTVGSEARKHCYLWWKIWLALTGGKQAVLVLSCKNHPLLPQNERWCMLCTRISECGGLPQVNRLDKKHKVRRKKKTVWGAFHVWTCLLSKKCSPRAMRGQKCPLGCINHLLEDALRRGSTGKHHEEQKEAKPLFSLQREVYRLL